MKNKNKKRVSNVRPSSIKKNKNKYLNPGNWAGKMKDIPCFLLGNGPSLNKVDLSLLDNYFTIGINRIFFKYDPTILIWQDLALWTQEKKKVKQTKAIKYCREGAETGGNKGYYAFKLTGRDPKLTSTPKELYGRGSSGAITYQFAYSLKCDPIILIGMDCRYKDGKTDFYGKNPMHRAHTLPACVKGLKFIRDNARGKTIINCSKNKVFGKRKTIEEAINTLDDRKWSREELENILLGKA